MLRLVLSLLFLSTIATARVSFSHSVILDEFDFVGQSTVNVAGLCSDTCNLYASIAPGTENLANLILIQTPKGFTSLTSLANQKDASTSRKLPLQISNTPTLSIINGNSGTTAGPLVIYVVNKAADFFSTAEVYDADGMDRHRSTDVTQVITILSARPFTLTETNSEPLGALARLTGFDTFNAQDKCPNVYYLISAPFPGFTLTINAPIVTLKYDTQDFRNPIGELQATIGIRSSHPMEESGYIASPGYHGCPGKPAYKSSLYDLSTPMLSEITDTISQKVSYTVLTNSDSAHALTVLNRDGEKMASYYDIGDSQPAYGTIFDKLVQFSWTPQADSYFLVRYNTTA